MAMEPKARRVESSNMVGGKPNQKAIRKNTETANKLGMALRDFTATVSPKKKMKMIKAKAYSGVILFVQLS